jgi:hypothetical protein
LIDEVWNEVTRGMEYGFDVHGEDFVELVFSDFYCWLDFVSSVSNFHHPIPGNIEESRMAVDGLYFVFVARTSIVDENIHSSPFCERVLHQLLPVLFLGYISLDEMHGVWMSCICDSFSTNGAIKISGTVLNMEIPQMM